MFTAEDLYERLKVNFAPFRVITNSGEEYDVFDRRLFVVGRNYLQIGIQANGEPDGVCDPIINLDLTAIREIKTLSRTTTTAAS
jgi:hypothetical protein